MNHDLLEPHIEKIYDYAANNTYSRDEADDLAQEILFTAVRELTNLRDESKFEAWLWGIARNLTKSFRRKCGKQRAMFCYDMITGLSYEDVYFDEQEELYDALRTKIAMLSAKYREIIVLYYYDGLSTKAIAEQLNIPEGTVRWRLTEARQKIKKEGLEVKKTAINPVKMYIYIYGHGYYNGKNIPFPGEYISDALSKHIVYHCYEEPKGIEELANLCGVPAFYIEDRMENLLHRAAVIEVSKGKYQTDFAIYSDQHNLYYRENAERMLMPIMDKLLDALDNVAKDAADIGFHKAGRSETDLFYLYGALAFEYIQRNCCNLPNPDIPINYDGNRWRYLGDMRTNKYGWFPITRNYNSNLSDRGWCAYFTFGVVGGVAFRKNMERPVVKVCEDLLFDGVTADVETAAEAIRDGYVEKQPDGSFFVAVPFFTIEQTAAFEASVERHLVPLMPEYFAIINRFIAGYKKLFPKHLNDDVDRFCRYMSGEFYAAIIAYAQRTGAIQKPSPGQYCDALVQFKEKQKLF